jgi:hypothetical protein
LWIEIEIFPELPAFVERLLLRRGIPWVVDYDDAVFHHYSLQAAAPRLFNTLSAAASSAKTIPGD